MALFDRNRNGKLDADERGGLMRLLDTLGGTPQR